MNERINEFKKFPPLRPEDDANFSIIITTFELRFFEFAIPLISKIRNEIDTPIFVMINGNYEKSLNNQNLQIFIKELGNFSGVYPTTFANFHGLSELWNTGIINSDSEYYLILNDDIHIFPNTLAQSLKMLKENLIQNDLVTINGSFSNFGISLKCIEEVGFFDEHFLGISEEDRDYVFRFEEKYRKSYSNVFSEAFHHFSDDSVDKSVKKIPLHRKYSLFNLKIFEEFYIHDELSDIYGVYGLPMTRISRFKDPRPLWKFRKSNYKKIGE